VILQAHITILIEAHEKDHKCAMIIVDVHLNTFNAVISPGDAVAAAHALHRRSPMAHNAIGLQ
jgi:hypothetical protein